MPANRGRRILTVPLRPSPSKVCAWVSVVLALAASCRPEGRPVPLLPGPGVDGERALALAAEIVAVGPRPSGSEGGQATARLLERLCRDAGLQSEIDQWAEQTDAGEVVFRNVHAVLGGRGEARILLGSHYDTKRLEDVPEFEGANDSASSSALLLELARCLAAVRPWTGCTVEFVFFDGEECVERYGSRDGLHGSRHYAARIRREGTQELYRAMVLLDMIGDKDLRVTLPSDSDPALARRVFRIAEGQGVRDRFGYYARGKILDDHVPFRRLGIPAIDLIDFAYGPGNAYWHTSQDTLDKLSAESLRIVGGVCLQLVWELAHE